jgi:amidase
VRISGLGVLGGTPGNDSIAGTLGPFARSLRDIELFCKSYSSACPWIDDVSLVPGSILSPSLGLQANENRPLRVGILVNDGNVSPLPPVRYIIKKVHDLLSRAAGIEVVPFSPMDHATGWSIIAANYFEDGGASIREICEKGEEPELPLTKWIIEQCQVSRSTVAQTPLGIKHARDAYRQAYSDHWNRSGVDVVIAPVCPSTAGPHNTRRYWAYSAIWNLLQYPVLAMPAAKLVGGPSLEELKQELYSPKNNIEAHYHEHYSPEMAAGMPVGVQVVAKRLHESLLLHAARVIDDALKSL